jgi:hypothetical protein
MKSAATGRQLAGALMAAADELDPVPGPEID